MSSGFNEILLIVVILLAILFIPRMMAPRSRFEKKPKQPLKGLMKLGAGWRLALLVTFLWLLGTTVYFRPWQGNAGKFMLMGVGPILLGWGITWVVAGLGQRDRKGQAPSKKTSR